MKYLTSGFIKFIAIMMLFVSIASCGGKEDRKIKYLEKGKVYLEEKNYDKAKIEFKNVMQIDPKFADAYYFMGRLEEKKRAFRKALSNYKKAVELKPEYTEAKVKLATIYSIAGTEDFIKKARKLLAEAKAEDPDNNEVDFVLANIEYKTGSKDKAIKEMERVVAKDIKIAGAVSMLANVYVINKKNKEAIELLYKGVSAIPDDIYMRTTLSKLLAGNGDLKGAEEQLKECINIQPENYELQAFLSTFFANTNQLDKAESVLRNAIAQNDDDAQRYLVLVEFLSSRVSVKKGIDELQQAIDNKPELYDLKFAQIEFYKKIGKRDEAKELLLQIIADKPAELEGVKSRNILAGMLLNEGDQIGAKRYAEEVLEEFPNNNDAVFIKSKLALANLDAIDAINGLRTIVKNDPKNAVASLLLAQAYELNNESILAENELKKSIELNPVDEKTHANYASYLGSKGRIDESLVVVDRALVYFKESYTLMEIKLKIIRSQGKESEFIALLDAMESVEATKPDVNILRGKYYLSKRESNKALMEFEKAYEKAKDKHASLESIVKIYVANKETDKAISRLQKILNKEPDNALANLLLGQVYMLQNKNTQAREKFKIASKTSETWFPPYVNLASSYLREENLDQALFVYKDAISKLSFTNKITAKIQMTSIYERQKKYTDAMTIYKEILTVSPSNKIATNNYASLLLDHGDEADFKKALELSKGFEKIQNSAFKDTLAWAHVKTGEYAKAVEILKPIVEKTPKAAVFRYHLGYALNQMGDKTAAKSHLEIAASSKQDFSGKAEAVSLLKSM